MKIFAGPQRGTALLLALAFAATALAAAPLPAWATQAITSAGPLTSVVATDDLNCAVNHADDQAGEFYLDTACGTLVAVGGSLYGPAVIPAGAGAGPRTPYTPVSQSAVAGSGTAADPYRIVTVVDLGTSGLRLTQTDSYVVGEESYRTDVALVNRGRATATGVVYRAGDCFLQNSDRGFGRVDEASGAVACVAEDLDLPGTPGDRVEQWLPLTAGSSYLHAGFSEVWARIGAQEPFDDTCRCNDLIDNGAGLSWNVSLAAGASATYSHLTTFSPLGEVPVTTAKTADEAASEPGAANGYTITVTNTNETSTTLTAIVDTLPEGFSYVVGSTTGVTSADPAVAGRELTWTGPFEVPAGADAVLDFGVTVAVEPGTYFNEAGATSDDAIVSPTGPTAPVEVLGDEPPPPPPSPSPSVPHGGFDGDPATTGRVDFDDPAEGAIAVSRARFDLEAEGATFDSHRGPAYVVLSRDDVFADSLAGAPLSAEGPLLFTKRTELGAPTFAEIERVLPPDAAERRVYLLGGTVAIGQEVEDELEAAGLTVIRLAGTTRVETAVAVADEVHALFGAGSRVALARSTGPATEPTAQWADSVTGGAWAASEKIPILVTPSDALHPAVAEWIDAKSPAQVVMLGGEVALSAAVESAIPNALRIFGRERTETAAAIATMLWELEEDPRFVVINGFREDGWQFGLSAGGLAADAKAPVVMVNNDEVPLATAALMGSCGDPRIDLLLMGGAAVITPEVGAALDLLDGGEC